MHIRVCISLYLYKGAIPRYRSQGMSQTKRGDISYNWKGSLESGKQRHPRCHNVYLQKILHDRVNNIFCY